MKRFAFIETWKKAYPIERLCRVLAVTSRGFRAWRSRPMSQRQRVDLRLLVHIKEAYKLSRRTYGRPRMVEELKDMGFAVGHQPIGRLMRDNGIKAIRTRKYKATTNSKHGYAIAPNLLDRDFTAAVSTRNGRLISLTFGLAKVGCIPQGQALRSGSCYGSTFQTYYWLGGQQPYAPQAFPLVKRDLAIQALKMAITLRRPPRGCIHHSDRGSQYCSGDYQKLLTKHGFEVSMSGKGNCYE